MQLLGNLISAATAVFGVMYRDTMDPSSLGMTLSFAMRVGDTISQNFSHFSGDCSSYYAIQHNTTCRYSIEYYGMRTCRLKTNHILSQVGGNITMSIQFMCELEVQTVSVERIKDYSELETEVGKHPN